MRDIWNDGIIEDSNNSLTIELERSSVSGQWIISDECPYEYEDEDAMALAELANLELAVSGFMVDPVPYFARIDPADDVRILSAKLCSWCSLPCGNETPEGMQCLGWTQEADELIDVDTNHPHYQYGGTYTFNPLNTYCNTDSFINWYCVTEDGRVEGYTASIPHQYIRDLGN